MRRGTSMAAMSVRRTNSGRCSRRSIGAVGGTSRSTGRPIGVVGSSSRTSGTRGGSRSACSASCRRYAMVVLAFN